MKNCISEPSQAQADQTRQNLRLVAVKLGELLKYHAPLNHIDRVALAVFDFPRQHCVTNGITSVRARRIYEWVASLEKSRIPKCERESIFMTFATSLARDGPTRSRILEILSNHGIQVCVPSSELERKFDSLELHPRLVVHCRRLFGQRHFFHAVFEAVKVFEREVQSAAKIGRSGEALMMVAWDSEHGELKVAEGGSRSEMNVQEGIKFLSAGVVRAFRNPAAHEPAMGWPIHEQDAVDILGLVSFLLRQLDRAVIRRKRDSTFNFRV